MCAAQNRKTSECHRADRSVTLALKQQHQEQWWWWRCWWWWRAMLESSAEQSRTRSSSVRAGGRESGEEPAGRGLVCGVTRRAPRFRKAANPGRATAQSRQKHGAGSAREAAGRRGTLAVFREQWAAIGGVGEAARVSNNARRRRSGNIMKIRPDRSAGGVNFASLFLVTVFLAGSRGDCGAGHWPNLESRVVMAPVVFLGRARGRGNPGADGLYGVTFQVNAVLKGAMPPPLRSQVRLTFKKPLPRGAVEQHPRRHRRRSVACYVAASVRPGREYYVFAQLDNLNLTAFAPPANVNKRNQKVVSNSICDKCAVVPQLPHAQWIMYGIGAARVAIPELFLQLSSSSTRRFFPACAAFRRELDEDRLGRGHQGIQAAIRGLLPAPGGRIVLSINPTTSQIRDRAETPFTTRQGTSTATRVKHEAVCNQAQAGNRVRPHAARVGGSSGWHDGGNLLTSGVLYLCTAEP
ncbi:unnamed protein product [Notodromas monacha]|uniref:Uncharacterized protein n=1 Tax=Notodromas monacha TaxID=399045 RepID=A0A7R9BGW8_9CRUS|nr:unnamed protein product [Notodromas monacha]CAG0914175.1 unnamed protein product [Notodromas monacha]